MTELLTPFTSILFPPGNTTHPPFSKAQPDCFIDLNLDQVLDAIVTGYDADALRPLFHTPLRSESIVRYRQDVFADLQQAGLLQLCSEFRTAMAAVRANLDYFRKIDIRSHKNMIFLRAVHLYCEGVQALKRGMRAATLVSVGLKGLLEYLGAYAESAVFQNLSQETTALRDALAKASYGMLFRSDKVTVRKYAGEPDYAATVLERFARFRDQAVHTTAPAEPEEEFYLNHIEEGILDLVSRLYTEEFARLDTYVTRYPDFMDEILARFDCEIAFYTAFLEYITPLKAAHLDFCLPAVSSTSKDIVVEASFDIALAAKRVAEKASIICNDFSLSGQERLLIVSGPNQGGKTTFARMFGQLHYLAALGCPVPGARAQLFLADAIFTHFEHEEDITNLRGKLEDELVRLHKSMVRMTSNSVIILNEIFNSTSLDDQIFLSRKILDLVLAAGAIGICVSFIDSLASWSDSMVSMVSTVDPADPAHRTFRILRRPPDGLAYALSLARKRGLTYDQLRQRIHS